MRKLIQIEIIGLNTFMKRKNKICEVCHNKPYLTLIEIKTGRQWTQKMVDTSSQLTFYSALIWLKYGRLPSKILLHWAKTIINEDGELKINGEITTFETTRTLSDIILMRGRINSAWEGIKQMGVKYYHGT